MLRIYIRRKDELTGHVFKSKESILKDKILLLPFTLVLLGVIKQEEWSCSTENICDKFEIYVSERKIDGRSKLAKQLEYFSWSNALTKKKNKQLNFKNYYDSRKRWS